MHNNTTHVKRWRSGASGSGRTYVTPTKAGSGPTRLYSVRPLHLVWSVGFALWLIAGLLAMEVFVASFALQYLHYKAAMALAHSHQQHLESFFADQEQHEMRGQDGAPDDPRRREMVDRRVNCQIKSKNLRQRSDCLFGLADKLFPSILLSASLALLISILMGLSLPPKADLPAGHSLIHTEASPPKPSQSPK